MTFSAIEIVVLTILGVSSFGAGWLLRKILAKSKEAELQRSVFETKGMLPQLESGIRNRDQRITTLGGELDEWKVKTHELERDVHAQESEVLSRDREMRLMRAELTSLKELAAERTAVADGDGEVPAGVASGHVSRLKKELEDAQRECVNLKTLLDERQAKLDALADIKTGRADGESGAIAAEPVATARDAEPDELKAALVTRDREIAELEQRLESQAQHYATIEGVISQRDDEIARANAEIAKWQARVPKLATSVGERDTTIAERNEEIAVLTALVEQRADEVSEALEEAERFRHEADQFRSETEQIQLEVTHAKQAANQAQAEAQAYSAEATLQRREAEALRESLTASENVVNEMTAAAGSAAERIARLENDIDALNVTIAERDDQLEALVSSHDSTVAQYETKLATALRLGRQEMDAQGSEIARLGAEADSSLRRVTELDGELDRVREEAVLAHSEVDVMRETLAAAEQKSAAVLAELETVQGALAVKAAQSEDFEACVDTERAENARLNDELRERVLELDALGARCDDAAARIESLETERLEQDKKIQAQQSDVSRGQAQAENERLEATRTADALVEQREEAERLREEVRDWHTRMAPLQDLLKRRDAIIVERETRIDTLEDQVTGLENVVREKAARIRAMEQEANRPNDHPSSPEAGEERVGYLERRAVEQMEKLREMMRELDGRAKTIASLEKERDLQAKSVEVLSQQLQDARLANERVLAQLRSAENADGTEVVDQPVAQAAAAERTEPAAEAELTMTPPQGLFEAAPDDRDDLKLVRGIGAGFEERLNQIGIYRLAQLSDLTESEVAWVEDRLSTYRGRLERDDWLGQATQLVDQLHAAHLAARFQNSARTAMERLSTR
jgi:predicted flap endonuclease-1-like 5' DNA nuclease